MKRPIALTAAALALAVPAILAASGFRSPSAPTVVSGLQERPDLSRRSGLISDNARRNAPARATVMAQGLDPLSLGTLRTVAEEDFSLMTEGTEEEPSKASMFYSENDPSYTYPWTNMKPGFCHLDGWGGHYAYQAGGQVALVAKDSQAHINTCMLNIGQTGLSVIEFRAKSLGHRTSMSVEAANTFNMSPTWDIFPSVGELDLPADEWTDVKVVLRGEGEYVLYNIVLLTAGTVLIDDVKVSAIEPYLAIPTGLSHSDYHGDYFTINWDAVEGAEKYQVTIYDADEWLNPQDLMVENAETTTNSYTFYDAEPAEPYYVTVRALNSEHTGYISDMLMVWDVEVPQFASVAKTADWTYNACWGPVRGAEVYNYMAYSKRVAKEDGPAFVTNEKFDALVDHDGNRTGWSHENNEGLSYSEYQVQGGVNQAGWRGKHSAPFDDYLCIDGWWYIVAGEDAGLLSPELDLSANGGRATLKVKLASEYMPASDPYNDYGVDLQTQCAVAVFAWDEAKGDYTQVRLNYIREVSLRWTEFTLDLDGLTDRCVIGLYAVSAPLNLYVSELSLSQDFQKGDEFLDPFCLRQYHDGVSIDIDVPAHNSGCELFHKVQSVTSKVVSTGWNDELVIQTGAWSTLGYACETEWTSAVAAPKAKLDAAVSCVDGRLEVVAPKGVASEVFNAAGMLVKSAEGSFGLDLPARGIYLVRSAGKTTKVAY